MLAINYSLYSDLFLVPSIQFQPCKFIIVPKTYELNSKMLRYHSIVDAARKVLDPLENEKTLYDTW